MPRTHRIIDSPLGPLTLVAADGALVSVWMDAQQHLPDESTFGVPDGEATPATDRAVLDAAAVQLAEYFTGGRTAFDLPLAPSGTAFQQQVWMLLREIGFGETTTYGTIAQALGRPTGSRAVGAAVGRNPLGIVVPCHRVVGGSGALTGYAGGIERKAWLLQHEGTLTPALALTPTPASP